MDPAFSDRLLHTVRTGAAHNPDPQAVLHAAYDAIIRGDFDAFAKSLADDVELNIHGFGPMNGSWRARDAVVAATRRNFASVAGQKPEIEGMISQGDCVAVLLREHGVFNSTQEACSIRCVQWFTFAEGKIKKIDEIVAST
jgi:ketosteroid isomerase-like protein